MRLKADHVDFALWFNLFDTLVFIIAVTDMFDIYAC